MEKEQKILHLFVFCLIDVNLVFGAGFFQIFSLGSFRTSFVKVGQVTRDNLVNRINSNRDTGGDKFSWKLKG